jgi:predicted permease
MLWRSRKERDLERELGLDLEQEAAELEERGMSPEEARYAARRAQGNSVLLKEEVREMWGWAWSERLVQDLRYAARILRKSPGFTTVAVLSLALGIGANTAVFSVLDAILLKMAPVSHPEELRVVTWEKHNEPKAMKGHSGYGIIDEHGRHVDGSFSYPAYKAFRDSQREASDVIAFAQNQFTVTAAGSSDVAFGHYVSGNYFTGLGTFPLLGRPILPEDDAPGRPAVVVLTHQYWERRFASDPGALNRVVYVNRRPATVVGVMRPSFQGLDPSRAIDVFVPMSTVAETGPPYYDLNAPDVWWVQVFARLKPGVSEGAGSAALQQVFARQIESYAGASAEVPAIVLEPGGRGIPLLRISIGNTVYILGGITAIVLLIACANLANLLLARYATRSREIAIRVSIGATRARLLRQMMIESLLLALAGGALGLLVAPPLFHAMIQLFSGRFTLGLDARLDLRTLAFTFAASVFTAVLFGILPAWRAARVAPAPALKESASIAAGRGLRHLLGRGLVSFQVALSLLLLVGTGLFIRTLLNLASVNLGFDSENLLTFQTDPSKSGYEPSQALSVYRRLETRLMAVPGVQSVAISQLPLIGGVVTNGGVKFPGSDKRNQTWFIFCSDSFLSTVRIPITLGTDLSAADFDHGAPRAVVNETFVHKYLPGVNPIGRVFSAPQWDPKSPPPLITIAGVARDAHYQGVRNPAPPTAYVLFGNRPTSDNNMVFMIRTHVEPESIESSVRQAVASVDGNLPVSAMRTEKEQIDRSLGTERLFGGLVTVFGLIAVALAAVGLYGIMSFSVARRTSEVGVRLALGARRSQVQWMVVRQSLAMAALGIAVGVPAALEISGVAAKMLYGVKPNDPLSIVVAAAAMAIVAALAAWIPALRASRVNPTAALRSE